MSRIYTYELGSKPGSVRRDQGIGQVPQLDTPNIQTADIVPVAEPSQGVNDAAQLMVAFGRAGDLASGIASVMRQDQAEQERQAMLAERKAMKDERLREKEAALQEGQGVLSWTEQSSDIIGKVDRGEDGFAFDPSRSNEDQAKLIVGVLTEGMPTEAAQGYARRAVPMIAQQFEAKRRALIENTNATLLEAAQARALVATTPEELSAAFEASSVIPGMTDVQRYSATYLTALRSAINDPARFDVIDKAMPAGMLAPERIDARMKMMAAQAQAAKAQATQIEDAVYGLSFKGDVTGALELINAQAGKSIPFEKAQQMRGQIVKNAQNTLENNVRLGIMGGMTADQVREMIAPNLQLSESDPAFVSAQTADQLVRFAEQQQEFDLSKAQVKAALVSGGAVNLTDAQHGKAVFEVFQETGVIGAGNQITNGEAFADGLTMAPAFSSEMRQVILSNLSSNNPANRLETAKAIGRMMANPMMAVRLDDMAGSNRSLRAMFQYAADSYRAGKFNNPNTANDTVMGMAQAGEVAAKADGTSPFEVAAQKAIAKDTVKDVGDLVNGLSAFYPSMVATRFGIDWINPDYTPDPVAGMAVMDRIASWYTDARTNFRDRPEAEAKKAALDMTKARIIDAVDMVKWDGNVIPTSIDGVLGTAYKMPANLRWAPEFEDEARADMAKQGVPADDVSRPTPFIQNGRLGWAFYRQGAKDYVYGKDNQVYLFIPSDKAKAKAEEYQRVREQKLKEFDQLNTLPDYKRYDGFVRNPGAARRILSD